MLPYLENAVDRFLEMLPPNTKNILEIGSDLPGEAVRALAEKTGVRVTGLNPDPDFPDLGQGEKERDNIFFIRGDGRSLPFPDKTFDAIFSVSTMEHIHGLRDFLQEVTRVLKSDGIFYTNFSPLWSSATGHHVYAKAGSKLASFWKPGKNPIPDYAHLLMEPEEMRAFLREGPCSEELIEPILDRIYYGDYINRCFFEEYMEAFQESPLEIKSLKMGGVKGPDEETLHHLHLKYGPGRNFTSSSITVLLKKESSVEPAQSDDKGQISGTSGLKHLDIVVNEFLEMLPSGSENILEIGSDMPGDVVSVLTRRTGAKVIGLNSAPLFPDSTKADRDGANAYLIRGDARSLPFPDDSFDAILSISTMEHVHGVEAFLEEVARVLRPEGLFHTNFSPIWSSAMGHHVYAKVGLKLASFWRSGKNPIPDYAHLLMTREEMREHLKSGPCSEELIEPIIQWIYTGDEINRCRFEEYMEAFQKSSMKLETLRLKSLREPDEATLAKLHSRHGSNRNYSYSHIAATFRKMQKPPESPESVEEFYRAFLEPARAPLYKRFLEWAKLNPNKVRILFIFWIFYTIFLLVASQVFYKFLL